MQVLQAGTHDPAIPQLSVCQKWFAPKQVLVLWNDNDTGVSALPTVMPQSPPAKTVVLLNMCCQLLLQSGQHVQPGAAQAAGVRTVPKRFLHDGQSGPESG